MLTNKELIKAIAADTNESQVLVATFLKSLAKVVPANNGAAITDLGKFTVKLRTGNAPGTSKPYSTNGLVFKQSSVAKAAIN